LRVQTQSGQVPIGNFVKRLPVQRVGYINRVGGNRVITVSSNVGGALCRSSRGGSFHSAAGTLSANGS
jgi:hypothetical protein